MVTKPIHRVMFDADGILSQGLHTYDADIAKRWLHDAPQNAKAAGHMRAPYIVHFEPAHHGWPDHHALRILKRLGADCELKPDGFIVIRQPTDAVRRAVARLALSVHVDTADALEVRAPQGDTHGLDVIRAVHRLHADIVRNADGSIQVRNLYHYPDHEPGKEPNAPTDWAPQNPMLSKRQWAKIPQAISRSHYVVKQPEPTP